MTRLIVGFQDLSLEGARELVEARLGITMVPHDSSFHGGDYYACRGSRDEEFILQVNFDDCFDGDWAEPELADCPLVMYVDRTHRAREIANAISPPARVLRGLDERD